MTRGGPTTGQGVEDLLDRWLEDAALLAPDAGRDLWLAEGSLLLQRWSEPHRRYHTPQHLAEVLAAIDQLTVAGPLTADDALLARTVGWYHDLAHDPRATQGSNEHRSATLARDHLHRLGVEPATVDAVEAGTLMTIAHEIPCGTTSAAALQAVHDADLWILSAPPERYAAYRAQVREEYSHVPDHAFRAGRRAILAAFLDRDRLYRTDHAHARWTDLARANLTLEIGALSDRV